MAIHDRHIEHLIARYVKTGDLIALGTSELGKRFLKKLAFALEEEDVDLWNVSIVPTSFEIATIASSFGIKLESINEREVDIAIEFADKVDLQFNYIKADSSSLVRDKMIAQSAAELIVVTEEKNYGEKLKGTIPFEISTFGWKRTVNQLSVFGRASLRMKNKKPYRTESGNCLADVVFDEIYDLHDLEFKGKEIPGVLETGLFLGYADRVITHNGQVKIKSRMEYK